MTRAYLKFPIAELIEAMTVDAIEKKIFRKAFFAVCKMIGGAGVVTQTADIELFQQSIVLDAGFQYRFGDLDALSSDTVPDILMRPHFILLHCRNLVYF